MKRIAYKEQPILHTHRYVVSVGRVPKAGAKFSVKFHYCMNRAEVRALKNDPRKICKGSVVEVYKATHEYIEGWEA